MRMKTISHTLETLPPLNDEDRAHLAALAAEPDQAIELGDMPELSDEQLRTAVRGRFYRPIKQQITARLDADVLDWLRSQGKGYQSRINTILRREMLAALKSKRA